MKRDRRVLGLLIAIQAALFVTFYYREIGWYPPPVCDQAVYLGRSYAIQESVARNGLPELLRPFITGGHDNSVAFPVEGALFGFFIAAPRLSRLCVNFVAFAILQLCVYSTATRIWGRHSYGFAAVGLILCESTPWYWAGGLFDYRMDFVAFCLYGTWACLVLRSGLFDDLRWSAGSALVAILLVLNRFLTIVYLCGVLVGFGITLAIFWMLSRQTRPPELNLRNRFRNLAISLIVLLCGTIPFLVLNAKAIHAYYVFPHLISHEKYVRAEEFGVTNAVRNLLFYPSSVLFDHLGVFFIGGASIALLGAIIFLIRSRHNVGPARARWRSATILQGIFLLGAIVGPLLVLTWDISKSPVVGGIVAVPCALLVLWLAASLGFGAAESDSLADRNSAAFCAAAILSLGGLNQLSHAAMHRLEEPETYQRLTEVHRWLGDNARESGLASPVISTDIVSQWFNAPAITATTYEQSGHLIVFRQLLGETIHGVDRVEALSDLKQSDYAVLTTVPKVGVYPFYEKIRNYWPDLKSWTDQNMVLFQTLPLEHQTFFVYARPMPKIVGVSGGWITSNGLDLEAETDTLERFPVISLTGTTEFDFLPKIPSVSVTVQRNKSSESVPVTLMRDGNNYTISFDASSLGRRETGHIRFHLSFDAFFIPKVLGINQDTRELVIRAPSRAEMRPKNL